MANPYLSLTPIPFPSQNFAALIQDATNNPSAGIDADPTLYPPSMEVDEDGANVVYADVTKTTATCGSVDLTVSGTFFLRVSGDNQTDARLTWQGVWPGMWVDFYVEGSTDPADDLDIYDARSDVNGPLTFAFSLEPNPTPGLLDTDDLLIPAVNRKESLVIPFRSAVISITDPTVCALFEGASGTVKIWAKPRVAAPSASIDDGASWADLDAVTGIVIQDNSLRFIGGLSVVVNRS